MALGGEGSEVTPHRRTPPVQGEGGQVAHPAVSKGGDGRPPSAGRCVFAGSFGWEG